MLFGITGKGLPPFHRDSNNRDETVPVRDHVRRDFSEVKRNGQKPGIL